jgi:hypothetical protein
LQELVEALVALLKSFWIKIAAETRIARWYFSNQKLNFW